MAGVLQALRRDLRTMLLPELTSDGARSTAQLMDEMLGWLAVGLNGAGGEAPPGERGGYDAGSELDGSEAFAVHAEALAGRARGSTAPEVRAAVGEEAARLADEDAAAAALAKDDPALEVPVTAGRIDAWLAARPELNVAGPVTALSRVVGGYSKDTWLLCLSGKIGGTGDLVLRRDLPFGPGENSVTEEYDILVRLHAAGLPVPEPLAIEADARILGKPFLLFPRLPGQAIFGEWAAEGAERASIARQVATCLARLHTLDPAALGLPVRDRADAVADLVRLWRAKWQRRRLYPSAILEAAYDWLERNVPQAPGQARLVHGDVSFRNTLIDRGQLVALLDWEFHHLGDPVEDLSYFQLVAEPHVDWNMVVQAYRDAGGEAYAPDRAKYYEIWRSTRNATTTATAWHGFVRGHYPVSKAAYQGLSLYRFFLRDIADKLKDVM